MDQWLEAGRRPHSRAGRRLTQTALQQRQEPCPPRGTALVCARPLKRLSQDAQPAGPGEKLPAGSRYGAVVGFESAYRDGEPPWDIGRAQPAFARLAEEGAIAGSVVDVGCGTGENALYFASLGHDVTGIDAAPTAIARARVKAAQRAIRVTFLEADAIDVGGVTRTFDNAIDSGFFHVLSDDERVRFARRLHAALGPGGRYFMLCFSDRQPGTAGPRRVSQAEIRAAFSNGWRVDSIVEDRFATHGDSSGPAPLAWLVSLTRLPDGEPRR